MDSIRTKWQKLKQNAACCLTGPMKDMQSSAELLWKTSWKVALVAEVEQLRCEAKKKYRLDKTQQQ